MMHGVDGVEVAERARSGCSRYVAVCTYVQEKKKSPKPPPGANMAPHQVPCVDMQFSSCRRCRGRARAELETGRFDMYVRVGQSGTNEMLSETKCGTLCTVTGDSAVRKEPHGRR